MEEKPIFICQTQGSNYFNLDQDVFEIMNIIKQELEHRNIKAIMLGIIK